MIDATGRPQSLLLLGGTSEIGLAVVRAAADRLTRVVLAGRDPVALEAAATALRADVPAATVIVLPLEASDPASLSAAVSGAFGEGDVDLTVLALGQLGDQASLEADPDSAYPLAVAGYVAPVVLGLHVARALREQGHGGLVVLSSVAGVRPRRANFVYGSTKAGLDAFARGLREALRGSGAFVTVVRPGFVHTRMTAHLSPAPFSTTADAVAAVVLDAVAHRRGVVWAPAPLRSVMGVLSLLPQPVFRRLPG